MDAELSRRLVKNVIELCNEYYRENCQPVPDHWIDVMGTEALLRMLKEDIEKRKKETN